MNHRLSRAAAAAAALAVGPSGAWACSTCKCGDNSITLFGSEKPYVNRLRLGLDTLLRSESQGDPAVNQRVTDEWRSSLGLAWNPSTQVSLAVQLPWVHKRIEDSSLSSVEAEGFGDIDLIARWTLWNPGERGRHLAGLRLGWRLPTSEEITANGQPLDIDVQPDAGASAPNLGVWYGHYRYPWFASAALTGYAYGDGRQGFEPGDALLLNTRLQYAVHPALALHGGIDARLSESNRFSGVVDEDSGGLLANARVGASWRFSSDWVAEAAVQFPVLDQLNGDQHEEPSYVASMAYDF